MRKYYDKPFIVKVSRVDGYPTIVLAKSVSLGIYPAIWMNASDFPALVPGTDYTYFICRYTKGGKLRAVCQVTKKKEHRV